MTKFLAARRAGTPDSRGPGFSEDSLSGRCWISTGMGSPSASPSALLGASAKQGRLSTAHDRPSDAHAPLGMTERERLRCSGWGIRSVSGPRQKADSSCLASLARRNDKVLRRMLVGRGRRDQRTPCRGRCWGSTGMGSPSASPSALLGASAKQGRLSTARDRPSDAHAPLGMTERESLRCTAAWGIRQRFRSPQKAGSSCLASLARRKCGDSSNTPIIRLPALIFRHDRQTA
jgi:hypothetical protein